MEFIMESLGFYVFAALIGFAIGLIVSKIASAKNDAVSGKIIIVEDEEESYMFLESYEEVEDLSGRDKAIFEVSHK